MNQLLIGASMAFQAWVASFLIEDVALSYSLGWALIHFVWQGLLIVGCTALLLNLLRKAAAHTRYVIACGGLLIAALVPLVTFLLLLQQMRSQTPAWTQGKGDGFGLVAWARSASSVEPEMQPVGSQANQSQLASLSPSVIANRESRSTVTVTTVWQWDLLLRFAVLGWTLGVLFCCVRLLGGLYKVHLWRRSCHPLAESSSICLVAELRRRMHINTAVGLLESVCIVTPVVIGWFKPVILLPVGLATGLSNKELESILAHELAHIRRHDYLVNVFQSIIEIALFYHPAIWWLSHQIRMERENCCDDEAIATIGNRLAFARALAHLEGLRHAESSVVMAASGGSLSRRIHRIMQMELKHPKAGTIVGLGLRVGASILMVCLGVSVSYASFVQEAGKVEDRKEANMSVVDANARAAKPTEGIALAQRSEQPGVRLIVSHTYATARRESKGWIEVDGVQVPVDVGILHDGVIVYLTLMNDVVAADITKPKAIWSLESSKEEPIWEVVSIVEVYVGEGRRELGVELFTSKSAKQGASYKYVSLKTGKELKPVGTRVDDMPTDSYKKAGVMFEVEATQATYRLTRDGWSYVTGSNVILRADLSDSNSAIFNQLPKNLELRAENARVTNGDVEAEAMRWSIPAGCKLRLELRGAEVIFSQSNECAQARIVSGEVDIIVDDQHKAKLRNSTGKGKFHLDCRPTDVGYEMEIIVDRSPGASASSGASLQLSLETPVQQPFIMESGVAILRFQVGDDSSVQPRTAKKEAQAWVQAPSQTAVPIPGLRDDLLRSIEEMGDWNDSDKRSPFQSWRYMLIANRMLEISETERIKIMRDLGTRGVEGPLVVLCRMLIESRDSIPLRGPRFGTPLLLPGDYREGENSQLPLVFIRDTPFLVVREYRFDGEKETALHFFEESLSKGRWRTKRYDTSDDAIDEVSSEMMRSQLWGDRVDSDEWNSIGVLLTQLRPSAMIRVASLKHVNVEEPVYVMEDEGGSNEEIVARLCQRVPENDRPNFNVLLHIDEDAKYEWVVGLLDAIRMKGFSSIRISLWQRRTDEISESELRSIIESKMPSLQESDDPM